MDNHFPLIIAIGSYFVRTCKSGHANVVFAVDKANNRSQTKDPVKDNDVIFNYDTITIIRRSRK